MTVAMQVPKHSFAEHARARSESACKPSCVAAAAQASHAPWWRKRDASDLTRYPDELLREDGLRLKADDAAAATEKTQGI